jgi:hypothetical protein
VIGTWPNGNTAGETSTGLIPEPRSEADNGLLAALVNTVICPDSLTPIAVGANWTPITQLEFAASVPPLVWQVVVALVSSWKGPEKSTELMLSGLDCRLWSVSVLVALVVFTTWLP